MDNTEMNEQMIKQIPDGIFIGLMNVHSVYSMKESTQTIKQIVERAKELNCPAISLTDNGNMFGMYEFYNECRENGIKPILGVKTHVDYGTSDARSIVLLAKNMDGLRAIFKAVTESNGRTVGKEQLFLMKKKSLVENFGEGSGGHGNVIATSGCINGVLAKAYSERNANISTTVSDENVTNEALWYKALFGEDFYIELQYHGMPEEEFVAKKLVKIAEQNGIRLTISNEPYMTNGTEDDILGKTIVETQLNKAWAEPRNCGKECYIKTEKEIVANLCKIIDINYILSALKGTKKIVESCNIDIPDQKHYPTAQVPHGYTAKTYLEKLVHDGLNERYGIGHDVKYDERAAYELSVIDKLNVNDYFLIVRDICEFGRLVAKLDLDDPDEVKLIRTFNKELIKDRVKGRTGEGIGHARGSACGSIVSYTTGITNVEPVDNGLYFSRFLSPNRVTMPDIDIDVETRTRAYCIEYMKHKYGEKCVAGITTFVKCAGRKALGVTAKALAYKQGRKSTYYDELARKIADTAEEISGDKEIDLAKDHNGNGTLEHELLERYKDTSNADFIIHGAALIQGSVCTKSQHAGGLILTDGTPLEDLIPLVWNETNQIMTIQCDMVNAEKHGLLKIDVLGLNTLTIITKAEKYIKERYGKTVSLTNIPFSDDVMTNVFQNGNTGTVFQMESDGMKQLNKQFKPCSLQDLAIENAMFRPGPMQFLDDVIKVRNGAKPEYLCKELEPILSETYGAIIYQEQIMRIARDLAGFSEARSDDCRRAMSKKKQSVLEGMRNAFVYGDDEAKGCIANGISEDIAVKIFEQMLKFSMYAFNKAHATAYAMLAYQTAWLKWNYPLEWMCANLNGVETEKYKTYFSDLKNRNYNILKPDVNESEVEFSIENDSIRYGLSKIKGIGVATKQIVEERRKNGKYKSLSDFVIRVKPDKKTLETLIMTGAMDCFYENRKSLMVMVTELLSIAKALRDEENGLDTALKEGNNLMAEKCRDAIKNAKSKAEALTPDKKIIEDEREKLETEKEYLFEYISAHPMDKYADPTCGTVNDLKALVNWKNTNVCAMISEINVIQRKKDGANMASLTITDKTGSVKIFCYANEYKVLSDKLKKDVAFKMNVQKRFSNDRKSYVLLDAEEKVIQDNKETIFIEVDNIAEWYYELQNAIKPYIDRNGNRCMIYDMALDEIRECEYLINPCITESKRFRAVLK